MNRFFGFLKQKLIEVKQENRNQLQNIVNAFDSQPYSKQKMLTYLQETKTNYLQWNIMIANEASTGLYFSQIHNKTCVLKKAKNQKESEEKISKNEILLEQMNKTVKELHKIAELNNDWAQSMSSKVQKLSKSVAQKEAKESLICQNYQSQMLPQAITEQKLVLQKAQPPKQLQQTSKSQIAPNQQNINEAPGETKAVQERPVKQEEQSK